MNSYVCFVLVIVGIAGITNAWICTSNWLKVFSRLGSRSVIPFKIAVPQSSETPATVHIRKVNQILLGVLFVDPPIARISATGYNLVGSIENGELYLEIENVTEEHAVSYVVSFADKYDEAVKCATLYILGVPTLPIISVDKTPSVGENVTLSCSSASTTIPANHSLILTYNWRIDNVDNPSGTRYSYSTSRGMLTVYSVVKEDIGKQFTCTATENATDGYTSERSNTLVMSVHYGPSEVRINVPSTFEVTEGEDIADIFCSCDCFPVCKYLWINRNGTLSTNTVLSLHKAARQQADNYTCICRSLELRISSVSSFYLLVKYAPDVSLRVIPPVIKKSEPFSVFCEAIGVPSIYNFTGFQQTFNDKLVERAHHSVFGTPENSSVYIPSAQLQDTGVYTCHVSNGIRKGGVLDQSGSIYINVQGITKFLSKDQVSYGKVGKYLDVTVQFYSQPVFQNITVIRSDGFKLTVSAKYSIDIYNVSVQTEFYTTPVLLNGKSVTLSFKNLTTEDFTDYQIIVNNAISYGTVKQSVLIKGPPLPPKNFQVSLFNGVLMFTWESNSNGGEDQYFLIQMSTEKGEDWNNQTIVQEFDIQHLLSAGHYVATVAITNGVYRFRIIATNTYGSSEAVYWSIPVEMKEQRAGECPENKQALLVGLLLTGLIVALVFVIIMLVRRIRRLQISQGTQTSKRAHIYSRKEDVSYANVAYSADSSTQRETDQYSSLDDRLRSDPKVYDVIANANIQ